MPFVRSPHLSPLWLVLSAACVAVAGCGNSGSSASSSGSTSGAAASPASATIAKAADAGGSGCSDVKLGGTMRFGVDQDVISFDPANTQDNGSLWADMNVYDQLVRLSPDAKKVVPGLAKSYDVVNGGKTYVFHLRDAKFSDGTPVTAADAKFSWDRARGPKALANFALAAVQSTKVVDDKTFSVTLKEPAAPFINDATLWPASIISEKAYKADPKGFKNKPVGSGPFSVASFKPGDKVVLKKNPNWWDKDTCGNSYPYLDEVDLDYVPNDNTRVTSLQGGQLDAIMDVPTNQIASLGDAQGITAATTPQLGGVSMALSQKVPAFTDPKVVQAINYALDRKAIVKAVFSGYATPATSPIFPGVYYHTDKYGYGYDVAKAKALIKASKFPNGATVTLSIPSGDTTASSIATIMQSELKEIGITLKIASADATTLSTRRQDEKLQISYGGGTSDNLDPNANMLFCCVSDGGADSGYTGWKDPAADALFTKTQRELDFDKRGILFDQWQKEIMEKGPFIWLVYQTNRFAFNKAYKDFFIQTTAHYPLWVAWKSQ